MSINKKIEITWKGKTHKLLITMRHVDEIEDDFNLISFAHQINIGDVRYTRLAKLISIVLIMCGEEVTQDDVWDELFGSGEISPLDVLAVGRVIVSACMPEIPEPKTDTKKKTLKKKPKK